MRFRLKEPFATGMPFLMSLSGMPSLSIDFSLSVFLVTVHDPICTQSGNLQNALYGSFLPIPSQDLFPEEDASVYARTEAPGAVIVQKQKITINKGRSRVQLRVTNHGDRPVQV